MTKQLFSEIKNLVTEARNPASEAIDTKSTEDILRIINQEDKTVPRVIEGELQYIARAVEIVVDAFKNGGRLFYIGAGTSGRLGVLDASECPPTFGTDSEMIQGIIAGGDEALVRAKEGSEDNRKQAVVDLMDRGFTRKDVACGIAACHRTPYTVAAIKQARKLGAKTLYIACIPRTDLKLKVDVAICPVGGPEVVMGSTRMKAGTATKLVLNMLTTTAMIKMGKVFGNMMVDLQMNSRKLEERAKKTVMMATGVDYDKATEVLKEARNHVKTAIVMILSDVAAAEADERLKASDGIVHRAISRIQP